MSSIKHGVAIVAAVSIALASACASAPAKRSPDIGPASTASETTIPAPASAEQLAERLLKLIAHLRMPEDLTPTQIQHYLGVSMQPSPSDSSRFEASGRIGDGWMYSLQTVPSSYSVAPHALRLRFDDGRDNGSDMSTICQFGYEQYKSSLERMGFEPRAIKGSTRQINFNHESGSGLYVVAYVRQESAANPNKRCVDMVVVDFRPRSPKPPHNP